MEQETERDDPTCPKCGSALEFFMGRWMHHTYTTEIVELGETWIEKSNEAWNEHCPNVNFS